MKDAVKRKLEEIAQCIYIKIKEKEDKGDDKLGLYSGDFGILLFLFYYARYSRKSNFVSLAEEYAEQLLNKLFSEKSYTFCDGLSGILYLFEFLRENDFVDIDICDAQPMLDNYIIGKMRQDIGQKHYDFMHGALGAGLYFLKKKEDTESVNKLINYLYNTAEKDDVHMIYKWKNHLTSINDAEYNIALSHGISSIILFLSRAIINNIQNEKLEQLLKGAVNFVLSQRQDNALYGSYFPSQSLQYVGKSRLGWCYGDLGVCLAIWQAAKTTNNDIWKNEALNILLHSIERKNINENRVIDAGLCHGSAGIYLIFKRMYNETKNIYFLKASEFWLKQAIQQSKFEDGLAGYNTYQHRTWVHDYSFLTGISGVGLTFISYLSNDDQIWDEILLLSS